MVTQQDSVMELVGNYRSYTSVKELANSDGSEAPESTPVCAASSVPCGVILGTALGTVIYQC